MTEENTIFEPNQLDIEDIDCPDNDENGVFLEDTALENAQSHIKDWMTVKDEITKLAAALANRRKRKKVLDTTIMKFMNENKIPHFDMSSGKLSLTSVNRKQAMNTKWITEKLNTIVGLSEEHKVQILAALNNRPVTQTSQLKHK